MNSFLILIINPNIIYLKINNLTKNKTIVNVYLKIIYAFRHNPKGIVHVSLFLPGPSPPQHIKKKLKHDCPELKNNTSSVPHIFFHILNNKLSFNFLHYRNKLHVIHRHTIIYIGRKKLKRYAIVFSIICKQKMPAQFLFFLDN